MSVLLALCLISTGVVYWTSAPWNWPVSHWMRFELYGAVCVVAGGVTVLWIRAYKQANRP